MGQCDSEGATRLERRRAIHTGYQHKHTWLEEERWLVQRSGMKRYGVASDHWDHQERSKCQGMDPVQLRGVHGHKKAQRKPKVSSILNGSVLISSNNLQMSSSQSELNTAIQPFTQEGH